MSNFSKVIAIDGPSGSGKSTVAKLVAKQNNLVYMDTGAMFRGIALYLHHQKILPKEEDRIKDRLKKLDFQYAKSEECLIEIDGENLTEAIREHYVSDLASKYSQVPNVRQFLKNLQRKIAAQRPAILEGRDIGTVIFPHAALKFFLSADPRVRAERRFLQLKEKEPSLSISVDDILADIEERDQMDRKRKEAPLKQAEDAIELDTTSLSISEVVAKITQYYQKNQEKFL